MTVEHTFHMQHHDWRSLLRAAGHLRRAQGGSSPASHRATPFSHDGYSGLGRSRLGSSLARSACLTEKVMSQGWYQWSFCWYHKKTKPRPAWYQNRNKTTRPGLLVLNLGFIPWSDTSRSLCSFPSLDLSISGHTRGLLKLELLRRGFTVTSIPVRHPAAVRAEPPNAKHHPGNLQAMLSTFDAA